MEVGADLYKIDTDAEASASAASDSAETPEAAAESSPAEKTTTTQPSEEKPVAAATSSSSERTPSIKFLGKEGWAQRLAGLQTPALVHIPPHYGRPLLTEEEMDALVSGGADIAPEVKKFSSGAMFGF